MTLVAAWKPTARALCLTAPGKSIWIGMLLCFCFAALKKP